MSNHLRRRRMVSFVSALSVISLGIGAPPAFANENPQATLAGCIADQAREDGVAEQDITQLQCRFDGGKFDDLTFLGNYPKLASVDLQKVEIKSLAGLEALPQLASLSLFQAQLSDVSDLGKLTKLTTLSLNDNKIEDVSALAALTNLKKLDLRKNYVYDLSALKDLTAKIDAKLQKPDLIRYVGDPVPVIKAQDGSVVTPSKQSHPYEPGATFETEGTYTASFRATLLFNGNLNVTVKPKAEKPQDVTPDEPENEQPDQPSPLPFPPAQPDGDHSASPVKDRILRSCIRLVPEHRIGENGVVTAEHVAQLTELHCVGRDIDSLEGLELAQNLKVLDLSQTHVSDLSPLNNLPKLEVLRVDKTQVRDLSKLTALPALKELYLANNEITSVEGMGQFPNLTHLSLLKNNLTDISALAGYSSLTFLNVAQNEITSLTPLEQLVKLGDLRAHHNKITSLAGIENLTALDNLELGTNEISSIAELTALSQLRTVSVRENQITDVSPLKNLTKPYRVDISQNPITNAHELESLQFQPPAPGADPNEPHGLINVQENVAPAKPEQPEAPADIPAPAIPQGGLAQWYGAPGAATGSAIAQHSCDVTGDGKEDIIVGAWAHEEKATGMVGVAYVLPNGSPAGDLDDPATGALKIYGPTPGSLTGFNVACVGDVNGDGKADIGISSHKADRGYVVFGTESTEPIHLDQLADKGFEISSSVAKIGAGWIVTAAGDVNGDSLGDLAVVSQAGGKDKRGEVTIIAGSTSNAPVTLQDSDRVLTRIVGNTDMPVFNVTQAGDVDGDGVDDFLVGGYYATATNAQAPKTGMAWVVSGKARGTVNVFDDFDGFAIQGPLRGGDRLGIAVAPLGDINDDGFADVMIAANPTHGNGAVAVVLGAKEHNTVTIDPAARLPITDSNGSRGWWITDSRPSGYLGYGMSGVPAREGKSGTIILGSSEAARVVAFDTSVLTGSVDNPLIQPATETGNALGGSVDLAQIDPAYKVEINGNADRLGRAVGVVNGFNDYAGMLMIAGADRAGNPTGRGSIVLAALPALHVLGKKVPGEPQTPGDSDTETPGDTQQPGGTEQPGNTSGAKQSGGAKQPGGMEQPSHKQPAGTHQQVTESTSNLARTGVGVGALGWVALALLLAGGGVIGYRAYRRTN